MRPTDEKRRDVAARLYEMIVSTNPTWPALMEVMGKRTRSGALMEIVHLIEPEERTCRDECDGELDFHCSKCGCHLYLIGIDNEPSLVLGEDDIQPSFCPNCGVKVVGK